MKTNAEYVRESEARKKAKGLRKVWVWAHPDDSNVIRRHAKKLRIARRLEEEK